jgi:hypothetical protein
MTATFSVRFRIELIAFLTLALLLSTSPYAGAENTKPPSKKGVSPAAGGADALQRRIDFGNSYILGQSIKSGAVYLLHRKKSEIKSMLHYREHYRDEILEPFKIDADGDLGLDKGAGLDAEALEPMTGKTVRK